MGEFLVKKKGFGIEASGFSELTYPELAQWLVCGYSEPLKPELE
jgi:hypothetical protein